MRSEIMTTPDRFAEQGFSLIEVLVALLVLSVGLLGLAALQTTGLAFNHQSYERTQAVIQAYDVIDRMRANKSGDGATINTTYNAVGLGSLPNTNQCSGHTCNCAAETCTGLQLAEYDIRYWNAANASILAEGKGAICKGTFSNDLSTCSPSGSIYKIALTWKEKDLNMRLDVETQP